MSINPELASDALLAFGGRPTGNEGVFQFEAGAQPVVLATIPRLIVVRHAVQWDPVRGGQRLHVDVIAHDMTLETIDE